LIIAGKALGLPKDNRDSIQKLADIQIIPAKLSARLEDMVSFRNLLVHRYGKVDDSRAYHFLKDEIYGWIEIDDDGAGARRRSGCVRQNPLSKIC